MLIVLRREYTKIKEGQVHRGILLVFLFHWKAVSLNFVVEFIK